jgi:hypothetical protein
VTWAEHARPERLPATYRRTHGIRYFHGCYSLGDDQLWGVIRARKGGDHTLAALKSIRAARPDGAPIYVILDNLSANKTPAIRAWTKRHKVELCLTPTYASWANPIEPQFGPLRTFVIGASNHPNHTLLARHLTPTCAGATPTHAIPTSWPPNAVNAPASAANANNAGAAPSSMIKTRRTFMVTALGCVWPDGHPSSQISSEAITTMARYGEWRTGHACAALAGLCWLDRFLWFVGGSVKATRRHAWGCWA